MTSVHVRLRVPDGTPAVGYLTCTPTRRFRSDNTIVLPSPVTVPLDQNGDANLDLAPSGVDWVWQIRERVRGGGTRFVAVPDATSIEYADLPEVDPRTLDPAQEPEAAWWAAIESLEVDPETVEQAVEDFLTENPVEVTAEWDGVTGKPDIFPPTEHRHTWAELDEVPDFAPADHGHAEYLTAADLPAPPDLSNYVVTDDPRLSDAREPLTHGHSIGQVSGLQAALDGKQAAGNYAAADHSHPDYLTAADLPAPPDLSNHVTTDDPRLSDARTPLSHTHAIGDVTGLQAALDGKQAAGNYAPAEHTHDQYLTAGDLPEPPDLSNYVTTDDGRLSDARQPLAHSHPEYLTEGDLPAIPTTPGDIGAQPAGDYAAASHNHDGAYRPASWVPGLADIPAGSVVRVVAPATARPTSRTDITVWWIGHTSEPANAILGDVWLEPTG